MIYLLKNFKRNFIKLCKDFYNEEKGNAASIFIIFTSTIILLISLLLFFIYGWEMNLLREEISDVVVREIYSINISKDKLMDTSNKYKKNLEKSIKKKIKDRFIISYKKNSLLRNLSNEYLYDIKETKLKVELNTLKLENIENSLLLKIKVELKFVFPLLFLMSFVRSDNFTYEKNSNVQIIKRRVNFVFEEMYTIY